MGNRTSTSSASTEGQESDGSGLYLTPDLQEKINADFESHILQSEWDKYRTLHLQRHHRREESSSVRQAEAQQKLEELRSQAGRVHSKLDEMVDSAKSRLVDLEVEVGHDLDRLGKKFQGSLSDAAPEGNCLDVRADLAHCYNTLRDSGECEIFSQKLEKCVTKVLASS